MLDVPSSAICQQDLFLLLCSLRLQWPCNPDNKRTQFENNSQESNAFLISQLSKIHSFVTLLLTAT